MSKQAQEDFGKINNNNNEGEFSNSKLTKVKHLTKVVVGMVIGLFMLMSFVVSAYRVPTGSMERTINIGDMLLVNKFVYGFRTPDWLGIPFTEFGFSIPWFKTFQFKKVKRGDIVVFKPPMDLNTYYVKRCVGVPGDTIKFINKNLYVNGKLFEDFYSTLEVDSSYKAGFPKSRNIQSKIEYPLDQYKDQLITELKQAGLYNSIDSTLYMDPEILKKTFTIKRGNENLKLSFYDYFEQYHITFCDQKLNALDKDNLKNILDNGYKIGVPKKIKVAEKDIFSVLNFRDNFGPIVVPKDHYFMCGDNRDNSSDSRYWGFVNKNYIVGKPIMVYFSYDSDYPLANLLKGIRWERIGYFLQ